jgi:hypothetical protein
MARLGRRSWRTLAVVLIVAVGIALNACTESSRTSIIPVPANRRCPDRVTSVPDVLMIMPQQDGIFAPGLAVWSPQQTCIAVVGDHRMHVYSPIGDPAIGIYNTLSGNLVTTIRPFNTIFDVVRNQPAAAGGKASLRVGVDSLLWSKDGQRLALSFTITTTEYVSVFRGVMVTDLAGQHSRVVAEPVSSATSPTLEWNLASGTGAPLMLPPALGYHWGENGSLIADVPLTTTSAPPPLAPAPIGNPDGDSAFTVWQPGGALLQLTATQPNSPVELPGVYRWLAHFAAWSPDGNYVVSEIMVDDRIEPAGHPAPHAQTLHEFQLNQTPLLPVRDAGLQAVYDSMHADSPSGVNARKMAWSPDGRLLATRLSYVAVGDGLDHSTLIYDTVTGQQLAALPPGGGGAVGSNFRASWSPDGTRLLMYNDNPQGPVGIVTIWGPGVLPAR